MDNFRAQDLTLACGLSAGQITQNGTSAQSDSADDISSSRSLPQKDEDRLAVAGQQYFVVEGELALLDMLRQYHELQQLAPELAPEIAHRTIELIKVRSFYSVGFRACAVIDDTIECCALQLFKAHRRATSVEHWTENMVVSGADSFCLELLAGRLLHPCYSAPWSQSMCMQMAHACHLVLQIFYA